MRENLLNEFSFESLNVQLYEYIVCAMSGIGYLSTQNLLANQFSYELFTLYESYVIME
jgi:hypothetical protein